jgi:adenylate cyclase
MQQAEVRLLEVDEAIGDETERELTFWLMRHGLTDDDEMALLEGFCARLISMGVPLTRAACGTDLLHPLFEARGVIWRRGKGVERQDYGREAMQDKSDDWTRSPFYQLTQPVADEAQGRVVRELRRRLDDSYERGEFPMLDRFQDEGLTDYLAMAVRMGSQASLGDIQGLLSSWTTNRPGGFTEQQAQLLRRLAPAFALAYKAIASVQTGRVLMATYLGADAGRRVLEGEIARGKAETGQAVLWYSDLQGFTRIADTTPKDELLSLLNDYADCIVTKVQDHGGQVLKFIGDGILAMFPLEDGNGACARALNAAQRVRKGFEIINSRRAEQGKPVTGFYLSLHVGEVLYGNIGSRDRLDFTVVGPAVNEVARIEAMCRSLDQWVIVSAAFAQAAGEARERLVGLGRYALRGVRRPEELFTIDPEG